jgi:predicted RNA-binding protein YlxR (DUF448 family)
MTRERASRLYVVLRDRHDAKMNAWNRITDDPRRSEQGRSQYAAFKRAARDHAATEKRIARARRQFPAAFASFTAGW